ncbi:MAG: ABC transporter ATP-binding protein, partial [Ruminococcus sp.]|nr:ABC transporter ATP-binding protein [Ruminococcus sp.]
MKKSASVKKTLARIKPYRIHLFGALLSAIVSISLTLLIPVLIGNALDEIVGKGSVDFADVARILGYIGFAIVGVSVCQWTMNCLVNTLSYYTVRDLRRDIFRKLNSVPLSAVDSHPHGDLISRVINDVDAVGDGLTQFFLQLFSGVITIVGTLIFMLAIDWKIALAVVVLTPLSLFAAGFIGKLTHRRFTEQQVLQGDISAFVEEHVGNQRLIQAFSYEERAEKGFDELNTKMYSVGFKAQLAGALANPTTRFVNALVYAAVGIFGALSAIGGALSIGQLSCFLTYANQYTKPFNEVTAVLTQLQTALAAAGRVFSLLEAEDELPEKDGGFRAENCSGEVSVKDVSFSYSPDKPLIEHFSLEVPVGCHVAIVGPTGCGKTTLINLLMRFYD